jgi:hypothetical protein
LLLIDNTSQLFTCRFRAPIQKQNHEYIGSSIDI